MSLSDLISYHASGAFWFWPLVSSSERKIDAQWKLSRICQLWAVRMTASELGRYAHEQFRPGLVCA